MTNLSSGSDFCNLFFVLQLEDKNQLDLFKKLEDLNNLVQSKEAEIGKNSLLKQDEEKQLAMEMEISEELSAFFSDSIENVSITQLIDWFNLMNYLEFINYASFWAIDKYIYIFRMPLS